MISRPVPAVASSIPGNVTIMSHSSARTAVWLLPAYPMVISTMCATISQKDVNPVHRGQRPSRSCPNARSTRGTRAINSTCTSNRSDAHRPVSRPADDIASVPPPASCCTPPLPTHNAVTISRLTPAPMAAASAHHGGVTRTGAGRAARSARRESPVVVMLPPSAARLRSCLTPPKTFLRREPSRGRRPRRSRPSVQCRGSGPAGRTTERLTARGARIRIETLSGPPEEPYNIVLDRGAERSDGLGGQPAYGDAVVEAVLVAAALAEHDVRAAGRGPYEENDD